MKRLLPAISMLFLSILPAVAQDPIPFATNILPTFSFTESYGETVSAGTVVPTSQSRFTITATASTQDIDMTALDSSSPFSVSIGAFTFNGALGDDPAYAQGTSTSMTETLTAFDSLGNQVDAGTVTVSWTASSIKIVVGVTRLDLFFLDAFNYIGMSGDINDLLPASFSFSDHGLTNRNCYVTGTASVTAKDFSGTSYDISLISLSGNTDSTRPTTTVTQPLASQIMYTPTVTMAGKSADTGGSGGVAQVLVQVNGGDFSPADGDVDWSLDVSAIEGLNTVNVKSVDLDGNESVLVTRKFTYSLTSPLTVIVTGSGSVTTGFLGKTNRITGNSFSITATPAVGSLFDSWSGGIASLNPTITFDQVPNMVLNAKFVTNPFPALLGQYSGLIVPGAGEMGGAGFLSIAVTTTGAFSTSIILGGVNYSVRGTMTGHGHFSGTILRKTGGPLTITMDLDPSNTTQQITGTITGLSTPSSFVANKAPFNAKTNPAPLRGAYTVLLPPDPAATGVDFPKGNGYGTLIVDGAGIARLAGALGDGTKVSASASLSKDGALPLFLSLYKTKGALFGVITFRDVTNVSDCDGPLTWIKTPVPTDALYPSGFTAHPTLVGSKYTAPPVGTRILNFQSGTLAWKDAGVTGTLSQAVTLSTASVLAPALPLNATFTFTFTTSSGLFTGSFVNPATHTASTFTGVVHQKQNLGGGLFISGGKSGSVSLQSP